MRHPDFTASWPQSGELVRGHENWVEIVKRFPQSGNVEGQVSGETKVSVTTVKTPLPFGPPILAMSGGSDTFTVQGMVTYPDKSQWYSVGICETKDGKVIKETGYFAEPFDPPEWRADLVEIED